MDLVFYEISLNKKNNIILNVAKTKKILISFFLKQTLISDATVAKSTFTYVAAAPFITDFEDVPCTHILGRPSLRWLFGR
jgi:hypothetical protein